jgi:hypothetical protein
MFNQLHSKMDELLTNNQTFAIAVVDPAPNSAIRKYEGGGCVQPVDATIPPGSINSTLFLRGG